ncbi:hypothetical protein [Kyrpidia spormannii]|uniref:Uncharacterized protein n=2 Tax=Kyrpidia spormannii TaxID=2055160 RepID=A0ACA8ZBZ3_9BACL|nr:hypothetical protein [Kyrpidia spormannii]CAB3394492.1 conserved protein of unknown function [Kyrpidia spormannii]CAB3395422.1 conserved protein of unknown function [Kyrpidia spormannii]
MNPRNVIAVLSSVVLLGGGWYALRTAQSMADARVNAGQPSATPSAAGSAAGPALQFDSKAPGGVSASTPGVVDSSGYNPGGATGPAVTQPPVTAPAVDTVTGASGHRTRNVITTGTFTSAGTAGNNAAVQTPPAAQGVTGASGGESHEHGEDHDAYEHGGSHESEQNDD